MLRRVHTDLETHFFGAAWRWNMLPSGIVRITHSTGGEVHLPLRGLVAGDLSVLAQVAAYTAMGQQVGYPIYLLPIASLTLVTFVPCYV